VGRGAFACQVGGINRVRYRNYFVVAGVIVLLPLITHGQTSMSSVMVTGTISKTVSLSAAPQFPRDNVQIVAQNDLEGLTLTLSGSGPDVAAVRVPILIRSNISYVVSTLVQSKAAVLANFAVLDVRPTGRFVAPDAVANLNVVRELDGRTTNGRIQTVSLPLSAPSPLAILGGPRISLSGTLKSADNALEVTLLITVKPDAGADGWLVRLTLSGSAGGQF
jgi:hypothetical protein